MKDTWFGIEVSAEVLTHLRETAVYYKHKISVTTPILELLQGFEAY